MSLHTYVPKSYHTTLGPHPPVLRIADGDSVVTTTVDASGRDHTGEPVTSGGNPQTGPFYVEGAEPGDTLVLQLDEILPNRAYGWSGSILAAHVLEPPHAGPLAHGQPDR